MERLTVIVPTLGTSPLLERCLVALREDGGEALSIVLVHQGEGEPPAPASLADRVLIARRPRGFAPAVNRGIAASRTELVAPVNDDLVVEKGWSAALVAALERTPRAAAAQGVNVSLADPRIADGYGIGWNRSWQAVQLGAGLPAPSPEAGEREIFGASATAAIYRREALAEVALPNGDVFESRLGSYYEDVDLACRLRAARWSAVLEPSARAAHAGSLTGSRRPAERLAQIHGNRLLVLARLFGGSFWRHAGRIMARDVADLLRATASLEGRRVAGISRGWLRAARLLPRFARRGPALISDEVLATFRESS